MTKEELRDKNKALELYADLADAKVDEVKGKLTKAKEIIERLLPLMPSGYNDMGNCDFAREVKEEAEQFLKEVSE